EVTRFPKSQVRGKQCARQGERRKRQGLHARLPSPSVDPASSRGTTGTSSRRNSSGGSGFENKNPWASSQAFSLRKESCSAVSTPSATTTSLSRRAIAITAETKSASSGLAEIASTNERSILITSTGNRRR